MKSEFDVLKTGKIHCQRPLGGGAVRSRSGTRNVRGLLRRHYVLLLRNVSRLVGLLDSAKSSLKH